MIELIPAIDIIDGKCVRLTKGDYNTKTVYGNPVEMAIMLADKGFERLHIVDLDGAKSKHIVNVKVLSEITSKTKLKVDFGGGIKTDDDIKMAFDNGAALVTIGSVAISNPELFDGWLEKYGADKIILGADVRNGRRSINGWKADSDTKLLPFLERYVKHGVKNVLCTEISKDGMMGGTAVELYSEIMNAYPTLHLIASGGVSKQEDINELNRRGIPAVVFGKSIYEGKIDLDKLLIWSRQ